MLSTESFDELKTLPCEHVSMPNTHEIATVSERIDYVMKACGCPTQAAFAVWLGISSQVITNWRNRDSIGRAGPKLRATTGASTDWIASGIGEPFPDGPILYRALEVADAAAVTKLDAQFNQLLLGIYALTDVVSAQSRAAGRELAQRFESARRGYQGDTGQDSPILSNLRDAASKAASALRHRNPHGERE